MTRRRVFHLIKGLGRGGAEVLLEQSLRFGDLERFEYGFGYFLPWKDAMVEPLRRTGTEVVCFEARSNLRILLSVRRVAEHLRHWGADLLHCHLPLSGIVGRLAARRAGVPVVYTEHSIGERYRPWTRSLNKATWRMQDRVIAVSEEVAASIASRGSSEVPVIVVRNGVDLEHFDPEQADGTRVRRELGFPDDAPVVGTVAVFRAPKGLHDWLAAAQAVLARRSDARFLLVGDGPLREELQAAASARGLDHAAVFAGFQEDVRPYLAAMDVYLMTSIFEGLPVALLEAMAMRRAVVVTAVGGIPEVVHDGQNGVLVETGVAAWAVLDLLQDHDRAVRLGSAARRTIADGFSAPAMVRRIEAVYDEILLRPDG